jgi:hypothetical protein
VSKHTKQREQGYRATACKVAVPSFNISTHGTFCSGRRREGDAASPQRALLQSQSDDEDVVQLLALATGSVATLHFRPPRYTTTPVTRSPQISLPAPASASFVRKTIGERIKIFKNLKTQHHRRKGSHSIFPEATAAMRPT